MVWGITLTSSPSIGFLAWILLVALSFFTAYPSGRRRFEKSEQVQRASQSFLRQAIKEDRVNGRDY
jgi:hypothetical protein